MKTTKRLLSLVVMSLAFFGTNATLKAQQKPKFTIAWSVYVGWMPWDYADKSGILKKWGNKYNVDISMVRMDYMPSVEALTAKKVAGVAVTNMEALNLPAAAGIDTTSIILGDYSNGNDAILTRGLPDVKSLRGQRVFLVEKSVSHYLLVRGLEKSGLQESNISIMNTSDSDIAPAFLANPSQKAVVTWNPQVMTIESQVVGVKKIFTSADIPGEILDLLVLRTDVLKNNPQLAKALTGAWYEVMQIMQQRGAPIRVTALQQMATASEATLAMFESQLKTTAMFYTPKSAVEYTEGKEIKVSMDFVRKFCFEHGLLGDNAPSANVVGISYPDGTVQGNRNNIKLRFDSTYMKLAAEGKL